MEAATLREEAKACEANVHESRERCDTDGFLSQWASGITAQLKRAQAELLDAGKTATFPGLYRRRDGARIRAKLINAQYGWCWAFCDAQGVFTRRFLPDTRTRRAKLWREGFEVRDEQAPAWARISGSGHGLSGCTSCYIDVYRTDGGYPDNAISAEG